MPRRLRQELLVNILTLAILPSQHPAMNIPVRPTRERPRLTKSQHDHPRDTWIYPREIENDLDSVVGLPKELKQETYTCAWEYTRCVIPVFTNWDRYLAFVRIIIIGIVAEFNGTLVDVAASDSVLGFDLGELFATIFAGTPAHTDMAREYRTFLLVTAEKSSKRYVYDY
jgi:hypothetical protein